MSLQREHAVEVRVIVPVRGATTHLIQCIESIVHSPLLAPIEIVVVDDGAIGDIQQLKTLYPVTIVTTTDQGDAAKARNCGAHGFSGKVLVFIDSDVVVEEHALDCLVRPLLEGKAEATIGNYSDNVSSLNFYQQYKQLYLSCVYSRREGYIVNQYWTALGAITTAAFRETGGFRTISGGALGEDTALGQTLTAKGFRILAVPGAKGKHLKAYNFSSLVRNDFKKGVNSFTLLASRPSHLPQFRHSLPRDIFAVSASYAFISLVLISLLAQRNEFWYATIGVLAAYCLWRADLLVYFFRKNIFFIVRALPLLFFLDLVRGVCVIYSLFKIIWRRQHQDFSGKTASQK